MILNTPVAELKIDKYALVSTVLYGTGKFIIMNRWSVDDRARLWELIFISTYVQAQGNEWETILRG
jgi:hypothetical protein